MKHFPAENSAGEFISLLEVIDYLYVEFSQLQETTKMASLNHNNRLLEVSNNLDAADKLILDNLESLNGTDLNKLIQEIKINFAQKRGENSDIHKVNSLYFIPMQILMKRVLESGFINEFVKNFTYAISKGIEFYSYVGSGYDRFHVEMLELQTKIDKNIEKTKAAIGKNTSK